jgi:hypothetical protein
MWIQTNPGPLESILKQDPHVASAVMFGRGRSTAGVLVAPKAEFKIDPANDVELARFRNLIWYFMPLNSNTLSNQLISRPTVERMNSYAPQHSRLFKEMILAESSAKPFTYTGKNTPRRQAIINEYESEIDAAYQAVLKSSQTDVPSPEKWDEISVLNFVSAIVQRVMGKEVGNDDNLFEHGCDRCVSLECSLDGDLICCQPTSYLYSKYSVPYRQRGNEARHSANPQHDSLPVSNHHRVDFLRDGLYFRFSVSCH